MLPVDQDGYAASRSRPFVGEPSAPAELTDALVAVLNAHGRDPAALDRQGRRGVPANSIESPGGLKVQA